MRPSWLAHLQLLDSALPVGAFSHSFGLETLIQQGDIADVESLRGYLETMLLQVWASSDVLAVCAAHGCGARGEWDGLFELDQRMQAARASLEAREGMRKIGHQLLRLGRSLYPDLVWEPLATAVTRGVCPGTYPTVVGWVTFHLRVDEAAAVEGYLYSCVLATVNNAVRLCAVGQTAAQGLVSALLPAIVAASQSAAQLDPYKFSTCAPAAEIAMLRHETLYSRLFMS